MCDLVGNPEDRFSHNEAHMLLCLLYIEAIAMIMLMLCLYLYYRDFLVEETAEEISCVFDDI